MFSCLNNLLKLCLHLFDIAAGENGNEPVYLIDVLIPPFKARKQPDRLIVKAPPQQPCRVSGNDGIGFDVAADHTVCADYRAVADMDAGEDNGVLPDPHIVPDDGVALERQLAELGCELLPAAAHDVERIGAHAAHAVVCAVHDELNALCDGAEFADDELVAQKLIVVRDMLLKAFRALVIIIGIVAYNYIRPRYDVFDVNELPDILVRVYFVRVRSCHAVFLLGLSR